MDREVLEFIIVPPYRERAAVTAAKERFEDCLSRRFPGYHIKIGPFAPIRDDQTFFVLPLMNFIDDDGKKQTCDQPRRWLMRDIARACEELYFTENKAC